MYCFCILFFGFVYRKRLNTVMRYFKNPQLNQIERNNPMHNERISFPFEENANVVSMGQKYFFNSRKVVEMRWSIILLWIGFEVFLKGEGNSFNTKQEANLLTNKPMKNPSSTLLSVTSSTSLCAVSTHYSLLCLLFKENIACT